MNNYEDNKAKHNVYAQVFLDDHKALVEINGQLGYEGVAVNFENKDRVHSIRILDTNGNQFVFYKNKTKSSYNGEGSGKTESDLPSNFSSKQSVPQSIKKSKPKNKNNLKGQKSKYDTIYDIDEDELWSDYEETHALDEIDPETGRTVGEPFLYI